MKKYIVLIVFFVTSSTFTYGQLYGSRTYSGFMVKKQHYSWCLYSCMQMLGLLSQCNYATTYARLYNGAWGHDCCSMDNDKDAYKLCVDDGGPYFDQVFSFVNVCFNNRYKGLNYLISYFVGPPINFNNLFPLIVVTVDGHSVLMYGFEIFGTVRDRSYTLYCVEPNTGTKSGYILRGSAVMGLSVLVP